MNWKARKILGVIRFFFLAMLMASGCTKASDQEHERAASEQPISIITTVGMVNDIVKEVAGPRAVCRSIIGPGVDPHLFKPTRSDVAALLGADVVFYSGLKLEGKMGEVLSKVAQRGKPVFAVTELIEEAYLLGDAPGHHDPHVWMDVQGWSAAVEAVCRSLSTFDPAHASDYRDRADRLQQELTALDQYIRTIMATVPEHQRLLITAHDAFSYFGRAYGLEVRGIQGLSTESEAGLDDINRLVSLIAERGVKAIFVETSVADKNVRALVEGARSKGHDLRIGGSLFSDAMGRSGTYEGTYIGMLDHNATVIARALGGSAPRGGYQDKLSMKEER